MKPYCPTAVELERMHALYLNGGMSRQGLPQGVYSDPFCLHGGCVGQMQAINFHLEHYGPAIHDPLVRAWWNDTGFAGRCPRCHGWIHFTVRDKLAIRDEEAKQLPQLPNDWHSVAIIL